MNIPPNEAAAHAAWVERSVALLDHSIEDFDAATVSRLNRVRQRALNQHAMRRRGWYLGGGLFAAGAALALALMLSPVHRGTAPAPPRDEGAAIADTDPLGSDDNLDLYENLDFYAWLDAQQDGNG